MNDRVHGKALADATDQRAPLETPADQRLRSKGPPYHHRQRRHDQDGNPAPLRGTRHLRGRQPCPMRQHHKIGFFVPAGGGDPATRKAV